MTVFENSIGQIGSSQISTTEKTTFNDSITQVGSSEITAIKPTSFDNGILNDRATQIGVVETGGIKFGTTQVGIAQVSSSEATFNNASVTQPGVAEIGFIKPNSVHQDTCQIYVSQVSPVEVQLSSTLMTVYEFLAGHTLASHSFNLQYTTVSNWLELFQAQAQLNLNFDITPHGQIAEAQTNRFDSQNRPLAGTILVDNGTSGTGWFIDPTPWESSGFSIQNAVSRAGSAHTPIYLTNE